MARLAGSGQHHNKLTGKISAGYRGSPGLTWSMRLGDAKLEGTKSELLESVAERASNYEKMESGLTPSPRPPRLSLSKPEQVHIVSRSQVGRALHHRNQWRPAPCRAEPPAVAQPKRNPQEGQLLYIALYRDKVAKQQAELLAEHERVAKKLAQQGGGNSPSGMAGLGDGCAASIVGESEIDSLDAAVAVQASKNFDLSAARAGVASTARSAIASSSTAMSKTGGQKRTLRQATLEQSAGTNAIGKATMHIASVTANPQHGGATAEYLEAKELSRLWEKWRAQQDEDMAGMETDISCSRDLSNWGGGRNRDRRGQLSIEVPRGYTQETPRSQETPRGRVDTDGNDETLSTDDLELTKSRRQNRMFNVITNPKVRTESFARTAGDTKSRPDATHIDGVPTLNLMRLYQGPWRLDV
eukprot:TRINITY_DN36647_c0_g1_i1.p1 TRINITY_DN36647_c0_g1~~TRINITY_DN36647_c0_g1_i1.p1  ORF type:complete len:414 (+),score=43.01 TRINITY_DN36647_c0_g1_i1:106-1347(+)